MVVFSGISQMTLHEKITASAAIIAILVGIGGFIATVCQLSRARDQLIKTEQTLRASNTYQVQKDARDLLLNRLVNDEELRNAIASTTVPLEIKQEIRSKLWLMFNFYLSVYRQAQAGGLSEQFVTSFKQDFCEFLKKPLVDATWNKELQSGQLSVNYADMRKTWC
jgi:hypothetical protein